MDKSLTAAIEQVAKLLRTQVKPLIKKRKITAINPSYTVERTAKLLREQLHKKS